MVYLDVGFRAYAMVGIQERIKYGPYTDTIIKQPRDTLMNKKLSGILNFFPEIYCRSCTPRQQEPTNNDGDGSHNNDQLLLTEKFPQYYRLDEIPPSLRTNKLFKRSESVTSTVVI